MRVAIIGCGLIGRKRALALAVDDQIVGCCDVNRESAEKFSQEFSCRYFIDYQDMLKEVKCDIIIVAVVNKYIKEIVIDALKTGKHVLAEKPLGRNAGESAEILKYLIVSHSPVLSVSQSPDLPVSQSPVLPFSRSPILPFSQSLILKTGFNHRFHPAIWQAKQRVNNGEIGKILNIRARYGHGGRPGMEKEWRASKDLCGGGELLDQGVHVIDLIRWFGGDITEVYGKVETKFWDMEVEDNAFAILKTETDVTASLHVSWTNWKNIFSFEIFGSDGYIRVEGLGGSYGPETLEIGKRRKEGGRPDIQTVEFPPEDVSWKIEWQEMKNAIAEKRDVIGNGNDGLKANEVIEALYISSKNNCAVTLPLN